MSMPDRFEIGGNPDDNLPPTIIDFRVPRDIFSGTSQQKIRQQDGQKRMTEAKFGPKKIVSRNTRKHLEYLSQLEQFQFERALGHMEDATASPDDLQYVLGRAPKFLGLLPEEEYRERLDRLREGNYSNADVVKVSMHYLSGGNIMGMQATGRLLVEEPNEMTGAQIQRPGIPDVIDVALGTTIVNPDLELTGDQSLTE